jgi:hypothetical protein
VGAVQDEGRVITPAEHFKQAVEMAVMALVIAGIFGWNLASGRARLHYSISVSRASNPIGFWMVQGLIGLMFLATVYAVADSLSLS